MAAITGITNISTAGGAIRDEELHRVVDDLRAPTFADIVCDVRPVMEGMGNVQSLVLAPSELALATSGTITEGENSPEFQTLTYGRTQGTLATYAGFAVLSEESIFHSNRDALGGASLDRDAIGRLVKDVADQRDRVIHAKAVSHGNATGNDSTPLDLEQFYSAKATFLANDPLAGDMGYAMVLDQSVWSNQLEKSLGLSDATSINVDPATAELIGATRGFVGNVRGFMTFATTNVASDGSAKANYMVGAGQNSGGLVLWQFLYGNQRVFDPRIEVEQTEGQYKLSVRSRYVSAVGRTNNLLEVQSQA